MAAAAAHQLGEGVVLLQAYTAMVRDAGAGPPDALRGLEQVSNRLRHLDDALLDLARLDRRPPTRAGIDPSETLMAARRLLADRDEALVVEVRPDPLPLVQADPAQLERLFFHALRHAARSGRQVVVAAGQRDRLVHFHVGDERFAGDLGDRVGAVADRGAGGDVGVEVCRRVVCAHGGDLWLEHDGRALAFTLPAGTR